MKTSLRYRFGAVTVVLIVIVSLTLSSFLLVQYRQGFQGFYIESQAMTEEGLKEQVRQRGIALVTVLAENITNPLYLMDMEALLLTLAATRSSADIVQIRVYDNKGLIVHDGDELIPTYGQVIDDPMSISAISENGRITVSEKENSLIISRSVWIGDSPLGGVQLIMSLDEVNQKLANLSSRKKGLFDNAQSTFYLFALNTTVILLIFGVLITLYLSRRIVKPIEDVATAASKIGQNDFSKKLCYQDEDEIGDLVESFNDMSNKLQGETIRRELTEEKLRKQALYDPVTKLPNRTLILDRLSHAIKHSRRDHHKLALIFIDLDDFKKVNDTLGHSVGDQLLIESAKRLQSSVRPSDTVARLGGDEFLVLITGLSEGVGISAIVEKLLSQFRHHFELNDRKLMLTASIGIAIYPDDGHSEASLLRKADSAMYHSKDKGRNTYSYYTAQMNREVSRRLLIEEQMHIGLSENEFRVMYQPKIRLSDYRISGAEALLRWTNSKLGYVKPDEFIPIAEQAGLITELGDYVLSHTIQELIRWQGIQQDFTVSVNISPLQFRDIDLPAKIISILNKCGVTGESLDLEITEGVLLSGYSYVEDTLNQIKQQGVRISMDDFGTGYSSLNYIRKFPFDVIKIDKSFVQDIETDPEDCALIVATIAMAHALNLKVVAEGVETAAQLQFLEENGCDIVQGFYFSAAVPARQIDDLLLDSPIRITQDL